MKKITHCLNSSHSGHLSLYTGRVAWRNGTLAATEAVISDLTGVNLLRENYPACTASAATTAHNSAIATMFKPAAAGLKPKKSP